MRLASLPLLIAATAVSLAACSGGEPIESHDLAPRGGVGPRVAWDLGALPFPELPIPNDVASYADPTSPTGLRINASVVAPTRYEQRLRAQFDQMDGWGTFMPITVRFDQDIDVVDLATRHRDEFDFTNDAIYLVNLETGVPVPIDIGNGSYPLALKNTNGWFRNDPRAGQATLLLSTVDEDTNHDGILQVDEDTNFDGVMQRASLFPGTTNPYDSMTTFWEPEGAAGGTLIVRPLVPLEERTRYAVVLTDRLHGTNGPIRSPFPTIAHPSQLGWLRAMETHLSDATLRERFYGDLRWAGGTNASHVAFAWTFSTQTTVSDLFAVREGLYGRGRLAAISDVSPNFRPFTARGGAGCTDAQNTNRYIVPSAELQAMLRDLLPTLGFTGAQSQALVESYDWVDYVYIAQIDTPYLAGDPRSTDPDARWNLDLVATDPRTIGVDHVQLWIYVPKSRPGMTAPFPISFSAHGYGVGALQSIGFAGYFARFGLATVAANAPAHGFPLGSAAASTIRAFLSGRCLRDFGNALVAGRSRDLNGDGEPDNGGDFLTAHVFHTRDFIRQTALDYMQAIRGFTGILYSLQGNVDYNNDGRLDAPGDLNGDGIVDIGGTLENGAPRPFTMWGESLGGITSMVLGAVDPAITAVSPVSGGGGLTDVVARSTVGGVGAAVLGPTMGPMVVGVPASQLQPDGSTTRTACTGSEISLRFLAPDVTDVGELEFGCSSIGADEAQMRPGDDIVVLNERLGTERCARIPADGRLFVPFASDAGDPLVVRVLDGHRITDYGTCRCSEGDSCYVHIRRELRTFEVGEGDCRQGCGHVPPRATAENTGVVRFARTSRLVSPASGLGLRRQTSTLRQFMQLAQAGIDPGDPVNYAPLFFLRPRTANAHPILAMSTAGDNDVPVAAANTFARAAGLVPFIRNATGTSLDEYTSPSSVWNVYQRTPANVLVDNHVIEAIARLERSPVPGHPTYLFDSSDLDDGLSEWGENDLSPPLRMVRAARPVRGAAMQFVDLGTAGEHVEAVWSPSRDEPLASFVNAYVEPEGVHGFYPSDPSRQWDAGAYLANLIARFFATNGTDIPYFTDPSGHQCLARGECSYMAPRP